jgi:hypothetical protein
VNDVAKRRLIYDDTDAGELQQYGLGLSFDDDGITSVFVPQPRTNESPEADFAKMQEIGRRVAACWNAFVAWDVEAIERLSRERKV